MAPTIPAKKIFQTPSEPIVETIQATNIVVIHPGSMFLRIGRPTDHFPTTIPHCIARRCKAGFKKQLGEYLAPKVPLTKEAFSCVEETLRSTQRLLSSCLTSDGTIRYVGSPEKIYEFNEKSKPSVDATTTLPPSTLVSPNDDVLVGEDVLSLASGEPFHINWPIRRGKLNIRKGSGGSMTAVLSDIEKIWSTAIEKYLDIPLKDLSHYRAVLVVPDVYNRQHVKELVNLLLNNLKFGACFVHIESVCATFGAGLSFAVVIDVGDQKTSVSCVEDGISHRNTRLCMEYGGSDLTQFFHFLLNRNYFPYQNCDTRNQADAILLRELKEKFCHVNLDICGQHERSFTVKQPGKPIFSYSIMLGDDCLLAPLALFTPDILALTGYKKTSTLKLNEGDPGDPHDENFLIQTQRRGVKEPSDPGPQNAEFGLQMGLTADECNQGGLDEDLDVTSEGPTSMSQNAGMYESEIQCNQLYGVDQAVLQSIERCDSDDLKRKMYSCLLVVGGGMMFPGIHTWLRNRLAVQTPLNYRGEQLDIVIKPKEIDPRITVFKGAAIMSCLDTAQELWISRKEWQRYGVKMLRERSAFTW